MRKCDMCKLRHETYDNVCDECHDYDKFQLEFSTEPGALNIIRSDDKTRYTTKKEYSTDVCFLCTSSGTCNDVWRREGYEIKIGCEKRTGRKVDGNRKKSGKGKPRLGEMIIDIGPYLTMMCKVWEHGAVKHSKSGYKTVENGYEEYTNAMVRHQLLEEEEYFDQETGLPHAVHVAMNAVMRLAHIPKMIEDEEKE